MQGGGRGGVGGDRGTTSVPGDGRIAQLPHVLMGYEDCRAEDFTLPLPAPTTAFATAEVRNARVRTAGATPARSDCSLHVGKRRGNATPSPRTSTRGENTPCSAAPNPK